MQCEGRHTQGECTLRQTCTEGGHRDTSSHTCSWERAYKESLDENTNNCLHSYSWAKNDIAHSHSRGEHFAAPLVQVELKWM